MEAPKITNEHRWLEQFVGTWRVETECYLTPDGKPMTTLGMETVRTIGGIWIVGEGTGEMPGGGEFKSVLTIGFDPQKGKFVGSFIASMMTNLWPYEGTLSGSVLTLQSSGPSCTGDGTMAIYHDAYEVVSRDKRTLTATAQGTTGETISLMRAEYTRV